MMPQAVAVQDIVHRIWRTFGLCASRSRAAGRYNETRRASAFGSFPQPASAWTGTVLKARSRDLQRSPPARIYQITYGRFAKEGHRLAFGPAPPWTTSTTSLARERTRKTLVPHGYYPQDGRSHHRSGACEARRRYAEVRATRRKARHSEATSLGSRTETRSAPSGTSLFSAISSWTWQSLSSVSYLRVLLRQYATSRQNPPRCARRLTWPFRFPDQDHEELSRKMQRDKFRVPNVNWEPQIDILKKVGCMRDPRAQATRSGGLTLTQSLLG